MYTTGLSDELIATVDLPLYLVAGNVIKLTTLPGWLLAIKYLSHFFYGMDAMCNIYWRKILYIGEFVPSLHYVHTVRIVAVIQKSSQIFKIRNQFIIKRWFNTKPMHRFAYWSFIAASAISKTKGPIKRA